MDWGLNHLTDDSEMLVSELVTNALHASRQLEVPTPIALRLLADERRLIIEVRDCNVESGPQPREADDAAEHGRGLLALEALSNRWGARRVSYSMKAVWCELLT